MAYNPDTRPLPEGWEQHFETTKQMWYYVHMHSVPPKISFTHPADIVPIGRRRTSMMMNQPATIDMPRPGTAPSPKPPMPQPQLQPQVTGRTFAQQLFASSMDKSASSMINVSNSSLASEKSQGSSRHSTVPHHHHLPAADHHPHRTRTLPAIPPNPPHHVRPAHERAQTLWQGPGQGGYPANTSHVGSQQTPHLFTQASQPSGHSQTHLFPNHTGQPAQSGQAPGQTPHLVTHARPPSGLPSTSPMGNAAQAMLSPGPLSPLSLGSSSVSPSPPASSVLFSQGSTPLTSPASSPPLSPPMSPPMVAPTSPPMVAPTAVPMAPPVIPSYNIPSTTTISPAIAPNFNRPSNTNNIATTLVTKLAIGIAGGVLSNYTGLPAKLFTSVGNLVTDPKMIAMFKSAFSKTQAPVPEAELQAILQGKPNANYQAVINALMVQQQQFQASCLQTSMAGQPVPQPPVNYQALIAEIQRLQRISMGQGQGQGQATGVPGLQTAQSPFQALAAQQVQIAQQNVAAQHAALQQIQQNAVSQQQQFYTQTLQGIQQQQQQAVAQAMQSMQQHQQQAAAQQQATLSALAQQQHQQPWGGSTGQNGSHHIANAGQQQQQNPYAQIMHQVQTSMHQHQQQQQQQQQQQDQQQQMTDMLNSFNNDNGQQSQQQQQPSFVDMFNSALNSQQQPPPFDPSSLYGGGSDSSGGGGSMDTLQQSLANGSFGGGGGDFPQFGSSGTGLDGFIDGFSQGFSGPGVDPSAFTAGFDFGSMANSWTDNSC